MANAKHKTTEELLSEIEELKQNLSEANKALKKQLSDSRQHEEKSEQFLNSVYNGTNLAIAVVDVNEANEYHFKGVNRKHESIFGFKNEVYIGKTPKQLEKYFGKETIDSIVVKFNQCVKTKKLQINEQEVPGESGKETFWSNTIYPLLDNDGKVYRIITFSEDITERKLAEEITKDGEERFKAILDSSPFPIVIVDENENILHWGISAKKLFGHDPKTSQEWFELAYPDPDYRNEVMERFKPLFEVAVKSSKAVNAGEFRIVCKDGSTKICELFIQVIHKNLIITTNDITERKLAEEALTKSEEFSKELIESMSDGFSILNKNGVHLEVNLAFCKITGFQKEELIGVGVPHPYWPEEEYENIQKAFIKTSQGNFENFELVFKHKNGKRFPVLVSPSQIKDEKGNVISNFATVKDITERKLAEENLNAAKENLKNTFDLSPSIICKANLDTGYFIEANQAVTRILGYSVEEFTTTPFIELIHPDDQQKSTDEKVEQIKGKEVTFFENRYLCKDGSYKWMAWHGTAADEHGIVTAIGSDINERKRAEEKMRSTEENLKNTFDISPSIISKANVETGHFVEVNQAVTRILGHSVEEFTSKPLMDFIHPEDRQRTVDEISEQMKGMKTTSFENRYLCKDGSYKWLNWQSTKADKNGMVTAIGSDISESKIIEQEIVVAKENAEESEWKLKTALGSMTDAIFISDQDGNFINFNEAFATFHKFKDKEECAKTLKEYPVFLDVISLDGELVPLEMWVVPKALRGETGTNEEYILKRKNTGETWVGSYNYSPIRNNDGDIIGSVVTARDITEQKQAEEKLSFQSSLLEQVSNAIITIDFENIILTWNNHAEKLYQWSSEEAIGQNIINLLSPEEMKSEVHHNFEKLNTDGHWEGEFDVKRKDGTIISAHITNTYLKDNKGSNIGFIGISYDITERIKFQQEITKTKQFYEDIIEGVQDGIWVTDKNDVIFYANSAMEKIAGVPREQIQGNNVLKDFPEETTGEFNKYYKQAKKEKKPVWYVIKVTTPAQRNTWQNGWLIPQYQDKMFTGIICTIRDVTERKKAERSVRRLSTAVEQSPSMVVITDTAGIVEYVNPVFIELTGYSSAEAIGQKSNILKSGEQDAAFYKEMWKAVDSGKVWRGQFHNKKKNGELFWEAASISAILNESGDIINYIKIGEDITELKQVENDLINATEKALENEEKYRLLHENAGLGIGYYTADGTVISFNSIASKDMNGVPEDFAGKSIFDLFPEESADFYFARLQKAVKSNEIEVYEDCVQLPTQTKWFLSTYTKIVNSKSEVLGIQIISQNVTKIKQSEIELKNAKEKAEESDRLKSAFLSNMSHEIRTPMNGILGFINLLNEPNLSKSQIDEYSAIINKSGDRLLNTINDIIDISKIEAGEVLISTTETFINTEIKELYSFFTPEANRKGLSLFIEPSLSPEQLTVVTDSHKLHGILTNLIKNAIKYTEKGSITFGYFLKEKFIEFYVKDTGIGIHKDRIKAVFNRFEQADIEDTRVFEGSGLGLAISKAYVEMLGGEISVTSDETKGSTFTFTFPYIKTRKEKTEQLPDNKGDATTSTGKLNILIVEDDDVSSDFLRTILKNDFGKIIIVQDGIKAIESCKNMPKIDLVLMDINLPKMNGYDATREIRKFNKDLPIIAQTAYAMFGDKEKAIEAGCNGYIAKPINKTLLLATINKLLK